MTSYVVEGSRQLEQMLVVTFGRAASQELRERVRAQLVEAERLLSDDADRAADPSTRCSTCCSTTTRAARPAHRRVVDALVGFDAATIATTHQFCSMVLDSLGVAGDTDARPGWSRTSTTWSGGHVDDLYLRAFALDEPAAVRPRRRRSRSPARSSTTRRRDRAGGPRTARTAGRRVRSPRRAHEIDRRKRRLGVLSYDDLLSQLADALRADARPAAERMRQRWQIVLVDEFQDTDPVQWQVLDRAFTATPRWC